MALPLLASRRLFSSFVFRGQPSTLSSNLSLVRIRGLHGGSLSPPSATLPRAVQFFSSRIAFSTAAAEDSGASQTLEGRYASALFRVAKKKNQLEKVYGDLESVRNALKDSSEFRLFVDSPAVSVQQKLDVLRQLVNRYKFDPLTGNLLTTLVENKRLPMLARVADAFDAMYRKEKGEVKCLVTSAKPLSAQQQKEIVAALQNRAGTQARLIIDYAVSPQIMGGLVVRLGEQVLDFSVATRLDRLQSQLLAPL